MEIYVRKGFVLFSNFLGFGYPRMVVKMPSLGRGHGRDMQGSLCYLAFEADWERGVLWFSLSPHLLGLAFSLSQERGWVGALPLLCSY